MTSASLRQLASAMSPAHRAAVLAQMQPDAPKVRRGMNDLTLTLPIRTVNPLNGRQHWRAVSERGKREKEITAILLYRAGLPPPPVLVTLTRIGKRRMDSDGLAASLKHVRDSVAKAYGADDGDERFEFKCEQEIGKEYAVRVEIKERP